MWELTSLTYLLTYLLTPCEHAVPLRLLHRQLLHWSAVIIIQRTRLRCSLGFRTFCRLDPVVDRATRIDWLGCSHLVDNQSMSRLGWIWSISSSASGLPPCSSVIRPAVIMKETVSGCFFLNTVYYHPYAVFETEKFSYWFIRHSKSRLYSCALPCLGNLRPIVLGFSGLALSACPFAKCFFFTVTAGAAGP